MKKLGNNEYQCAHCGEVYENGWSDEEAHTEATEIFGKPPEEWNDEQVVICDDCFQEMNPANHPDQLKRAKEQI
jgi:hypothetical protein